MGRMRRMRRTRRMRRMRRTRRMRRIRMIRIMGRGNGRPQALASVAYSYLCPSPFSGPWIHPTSPPTSLSLHSNPLSLLLSFFLQYFPFTFFFLKGILFFNFSLEPGWMDPTPVHKKSLFLFLAIPGSFFLRDLVALCRSYLNCYFRDQV